MEGDAGNVGADGAQVPTGGTNRDFGNMLNAYIKKTPKKKHKGFSAWTKVK
jgi:hypothetical protein